MVESIFSKIKALPPLDNTVMQIQSICADPNSSMNDLLKIIEKDPMLTANILRAANSPLYGFSREVANISHATALFGMSTIRGFALSSAIRQNIKIDLSPYGISNNDFITITTAQSSLMLNWYSLVDRKLLDVLIPASFLMEIGKIIIAHEAIEQNKSKEFLNSIKDLKTPTLLSRTEKEFFGFSNEEVAAKIFEQWNLEFELVNAILYSNLQEDTPEHVLSYAKPLFIVKNAINIYDKLSEFSIQRTSSLIDQLNFKQDHFLSAIKNIRQ